ncbi:MAG TPA: hypothetical protein VGR64_09360, partial [Terracidiphilus sp.]|nr:hypothetical protein [Terracidiphilus sp.]
GYHDCAITIPARLFIQFRVGAIMETNRTRNHYRTAYDEASTELRRILGEFQRLSVQRERVEQLMQALKPAIGNDATGVQAPRQMTSYRPGLTLTTRVVVIQ